MRLIGLVGILAIGLSACAPGLPPAGTRADPAENDIPLTAEKVEQARADMSDIYDSDCYASRESTELAGGTIDACTLTHPGSDVSVALVGDSHSAHWLPPVEGIAEENDWQLRYFGKRGCSVGDYVVNDGEGRPYEECSAWNDELLTHLLDERYDIVMVSSSARMRLIQNGELLEQTDNEPARAEGMRRVWQKLRDNGSEVVVLLDTPYLKFNSPDCLLEHLDDTDECSVPYEKAAVEQPHPDALAAEAVEGVETIDMADQFCPDQQNCYAYLRNTVVFRDEHHMTAAFASSLEDELEDEFEETTALEAYMQP